jgi:hypothetical protein
MNKEMAKVEIAWKTHDGYTPQQAQEGKVPDLVGFQEIRCHIVFNVKMDFTRKALFVAGSHTTTAPSSMMYSSIISRDSIQLAFLIASLNDLDIMSCDLETAYLNAPCREKIWFKGGIKYGEDHGKVCIMVHSLYGLKSAGVAFHSSLAQIIGYTSTKTDPSVWLRKAAKDDGFEYYKMLFVYHVGDIVALSHRTKDAIHQMMQSTKSPILHSQGRTCQAARDLIRCKYFQNAAPRWTRGMDDFPQSLCQEFTCCRQKNTQRRRGRVHIKVECEKPFPYRLQTRN